MYACAAFIFCRLITDDRTAALKKTVAVSLLGEQQNNLQNNFALEGDRSVSFGTILIEERSISDDALPINSEFCCRVCKLR
jgi:hypothetical protein